MNRIPQRRRFIAAACGAVQMDHQRERHVCRTVLRPSDDELFGARVEIALMERGRIDRVEQASQLAHAYLDPVTVRRDDIASRGGVRHFDSSDYSNGASSIAPGPVESEDLRGRRPPPRRPVAWDPQETVRP